MIRIGVIEDEARMREEVCRYVEKTAGDFAEIQCRAYESAERFLEENSEYEILILDIRLPGINGIELGRILRERGKDTKLLYLTSYAEYAAESYLVEASQYILKESMDRRLPFGFMILLFLLAMAVVGRIKEPQVEEERS